MAGNIVQKNNQFTLGRPLTGGADTVTWTDQVALTAESERIAENSQANNLAELVAEVKSALSNQVANPKLATLLDHVVLRTRANPAINSSVVPESAVSINSFQSPQVNDIPAGTGTFTYESIAGNRVSSDGKLRGVLDIDAGSETNSKLILAGGIETTVLRRSNRQGLIALNRRGTEAEHDILEVQKNASGLGCKFQYTIGPIARDLQLDLVITPQNPRGAAPSSRDNGDHFQEGDILYYFIKFKKVDPSAADSATRLIWDFNVVRFDEHMNFIELQQYAETPSQVTEGGITYSQLFVSQFDYSRITLFGGDRSGASQHNHLWFESFQYTPANPIFNEIHPGTSDALARIRNRPSMQSKLLGLWQRNEIEIINFLGQLQENGMDIGTGTSVMFNPTQ